MERPNYRLSEVSVDGSPSRIVSSVVLRRSMSDIEDKTFWGKSCTGDDCSCDSDCKRHCNCDHAEKGHIPGCSVDVPCNCDEDCRYQDYQ